VSLVSRYLNWLQEGVPTGEVEFYPERDEQGRSSLEGVFIAGDLTGVPLLKLAGESGAETVRRFAADDGFHKARDASAGEVVDVVIVGAGPAGVAAAMECQAHDFSYRLFESASRLNTIVNFPRGKPIIITPPGPPAGGLRMDDGTKETLLEDLEKQITASGITISEGVMVKQIHRDGALLRVETSDGTTSTLRVVLALGKSGNSRKLGAAGDDLPKVYDRLFDPADFNGSKVLVVGGGDSALEASIALAGAGAEVTHSYRGASFSRPKEDNVRSFEALAAGGAIDVRLESTVKEVSGDEVLLAQTSGDVRVANDAVFALIGRELPTDFFKRSGIRMEGEKGRSYWVFLTDMLSFFTMLYFGKKGNAYDILSGAGGFWGSLKAYLLAPYAIAQRNGLLSGDEGFFGVLAAAVTAPFRADAAYGLGGYEAWLNPLSFLAGWVGSLIFLVFGAAALFFVLRSGRRYFGGAWPVIKYGYLIAAALAYFWVYLSSTMGNSVGWTLAPTQFYSFLYCTTMALFGIRRVLVKQTRYVLIQMSTLVFIQVFFLYLLPFQQIGDHYLFDILIGNHFPADSAFMAQVFPDGRWTCFWFILFWPLSINAFGATTFWTIFPLVQLGILFWMIRHWGKGIYCSWICSCGGMAESLGDEYRTRAPHGPRAKAWENVGQAVLLFALLATAMHYLEKRGIVFSHGSLLADSVWGGYLLLIDIVFAGTLGLGVYFFLSGRFWCRFGCPLAATMHIMTRFSRYRILAEKKKCISCNICTKVCHMGIDVMSFANKGIPMNDVECVRCSACVTYCPMDVLAFGKLGDADRRNLSRTAIPDNYTKDHWKAAIR
jgi:NosR/NirI family nitrous oxide reductase transcriptional regulator